MDKIKYALIGFGGIAENRIAKEGFACDKGRFAPLPGARLVGATDLNPLRAKAVEALGLKWYESTDEIINSNEIDAVFIATNNTSHAGIAQKAINAGKHVLVEKPMATTIEDASLMVELARTKKVSLMVDHMMTGNSWNIKASEMISAGKLGDVNDACFHMEFSYGSAPEEAATWRCSNPEELGGPVGDVASHCFYMAEFVLDSKIEEVACVYYPKTMDMVVEDGAYIKYKMSNGMTGSIKVGFNEPRGGLGGTLSNLGFEVYGSEATLRSYGTMFQLSGHPGEPIKMRLEIDNYSENKEVKIATDDIENIYQHVINAHARTIIDNYPSDGYDALHNLKLIYAAHNSARNGGKTIKI
ncbi:MAG: Gfo/Idh/MocA family oxidoreductase [Victivallales bacterium]|nr:Gfo/Idh/MocA family oxidoreductase [Victivallales bacterium]